MPVQVARKHLQEQKYRYTWSRDDGDAPFKGHSDRVKVDKDEGYEVIYFITKFMNKHGLTQVADSNKIEDILHSQSLSSVVYRDDLIAAIERKW